MSREQTSLVLSLVLSLSIGCARRQAVEKTLRGRIVVEDFEAFTWGGDWATVQFSQRADPRMKPVAEPVHSGTRACRLDVPPGESLTLITQHGTAFVGAGDKPSLPLPGAPERIGLWVHGTKSGHHLWLRLLDGQGAMTPLDLGVVDFDGWKFLEAAIPKAAPPVRLRGIVVRGGSGPLVLDDVTVTTTAKQPLHVAARPQDPEEEFTEEGSVRLRVVVQTLGAERIRGRGEVAAFRTDAPGKPIARRRFSFRVAPGEPCEVRTRLRLPAGVYRIVVRAGGAEHRQQVVVHPVRQPEVTTRVARAARRFRRRRDSLVVYESAFSPALLVETRQRTLTLFRGMRTVGLTPPGEALMRRRQLIHSSDRRAASATPRDRARREAQGPLLEPWLLLWFGESPAWYHVKLADGTPCPTFDVPFLVVLQNRPTSVDIGPDGLRLTFPRVGGRVAIMPLYGITRPSPSKTSRWKEDPNLLAPVVKWCRAWARALRAFPVDVHEEWRLLPGQDALQVRLRYDYLETKGEWGVQPLRVAPVPPLLMLARQAGLRVRFSKEPRPSGCDSSVGPWFVVPDADGYTYTIEGLSSYVAEALADVPAGTGPPVSLARNYREVASDAAKIPFWAGHGGERGRLATEALVRFILWPGNCRVQFDATHERLRALDGLAWQNEGEAPAEAAVAEHLRACWYAGFHAELWPLLRRRWHHIQALRSTLAAPSDWATLDFGSGKAHLDARLNAGVYYARLAARLAPPDEYAAAHYRAVKLLVAAYALTAGAPTYAARHSPWPTLAGLGSKPTALTRCWRGSLGFAPGPPALVSQPCDAGYRLASRLLPDYFRQKFRGGPFDLFGRHPEEWAKRAFVATGAPDLGTKFRAVRRRAGPFAGNYVYSVKPGPDGWPALVWASHRAPAGGPLLFGTIGTDPNTRGKLVRSVTLTPSLRLSAYEAIEIPPPPKESETPTPPRPKPPPAESDDDTPAQAPPRNTPDSAPGKGAPAK